MISLLLSFTGIVMLALKTYGAIELDWVWVLMPFWVGHVAWTLVFLFVFTYQLVSREGSKEEEYE